MVTRVHEKVAIVIYFTDLMTTHNDVIGHHKRDHAIRHPYRHQLCLGIESDFVNIQLGNDIPSFHITRDSPSKEHQNLLESLRLIPTSIITIMQTFLILSDRTEAGLD